MLGSAKRLFQEGLDQVVAVSGLEILIIDRPFRPSFVYGGAP